VRSSTRRAAGAAAALLAAACAATPARRAVPAAEVLVRSDEIAGDFVLEQEIRFRWGSGSGSSRALVQQLCGRLTVVLLTPIGTPGIVLRQDGEDVRVEERAGVSLPVDPQRVLRDIHRSLFVPLVGAPLGDGQRTGQQRGERVDELWESGRLAARTFHADSDPPERVKVTYPGGLAAGGVPAALSIENADLGYHLDVSTTSRVALVCEEHESLSTSRPR
jgi:hypothetical protein